MQNSITGVGMDVHAENNVLAAVRGSSEAIVFRAEFPNTPKGRERLAGKLAEHAPVRCHPRPARRTTTRGDRNRQEGQTAPPQEVHETARKRKTEGDRGRRRGEGTGRIHLGAWARIIA